jgi:hypothetical protein
MRWMFWSTLCGITKKSGDGRSCARHGSTACLLARTPARGRGMTAARDDETSSVFVEAWRTIHQDQTMLLTIQRDTYALGGTGYVVDRP